MNEVLHPPCPDAAWHLAVAYATATASFTVYQSQKMQTELQQGRHAMTNTMLDEQTQARPTWMHVSIEIVHMFMSDHSTPLQPCEPRSSIPPWHDERR
jgi:hypothetical protein